MNEPKNDPISIAALVCGVLSWLSTCCGIIPLVGFFAGLFGLMMAVLGLGLGLGGIVRSRNNPEMYSGKGLAIVGTVLGGLYLLLLVVGVILIMGLGVGAELLNSL